MCRHCTMSEYRQSKVESWVTAGCKADELIILQRPSAQSYPNTFVYMFKGVVLGFKRFDYVALDVHYAGDAIEEGKERVALGGLWIKGEHGAMKPQQHGGNLLGKLNSITSDKAPDPTNLDKFGNY